MSVLLLENKNSTEFENHKSVLLFKTRNDSTEIGICMSVLLLETLE